LPVELIGWQLCRGEAALGHEDIARIRALGTPAAGFTIDCNRTAMHAYRQQSGEVGIALPDPVAMAIALDPSICTEASSHLVEIDTGTELTRGMTVVDRLNVAADERNRDTWRDCLAGRKTSICWRIDIHRWKQLLVASLR
jgi:purine nucleosidase